jgi:RHS repeat-associated protein
MKAASAPALTCPRHAANVLTMTDYPPAADHRHGNTTTYTYNDIGQLATLTAPGSKVWSYTYDTGNRLSRVDIPNGMHTEYTYDTSGRQDAILHKDGTTVVQGFEYTFEDGGNITRIDHEDGSYWAYDYDGRDRLIEAERYDNTPTLLHRYTYTYDDGDNMLTKAVYDPSGPTTVTTTFTYNDANEQTNMNDGTASIDMTYDEWGRLVERDDGTHSATYAYRYGGKLHSVTSNFPGEGNVTYETGGDQKRRSRVAGASETWYNYTIGFDVISTEDDADGSSGSLTMTNVVRSPRAQVSASLADLAGTTPSSGTARYYATDHLGSTRSVWDAAKASVGTYEFTPYGNEYAYTGVAMNTLAGAFTGKPWDDTAKLFHFPYRQYSPDMARWTSRDPLGMVDGPNVHMYVKGMVIAHFDPMGLAPWPFNSVICNRGRRCIVIWSTEKGSRALEPGECTDPYADDGDYFYWNGRWYKVGVDTVDVDDDGPSGGNPNPEWEPPPPSDSICGC